MQVKAGNAAVRPVTSMEAFLTPEVQKAASRSLLLVRRDAVNLSRALHAASSHGGDAREPIGRPEGIT